MDKKLPKQQYNDLKRFLQKSVGFSFSTCQKHELIPKLYKAAMELGFDSMTDFAKNVLEKKLTNGQYNTLINKLTTGETFFMREKTSMDYLEKVYIPFLLKQKIKGKRKLKIWCAGCCTGEEPYSIAILLNNAIPGIQLWDVSIVATDINDEYLEKAKKGIYSKWSFREVTEKFIEKNFQNIDNKNYRIKSKIKDMVTFSQLNLIQDNYPTMHGKTVEFDIIFCRNVLIYFSQQAMKQVVKKLYGSLKNNGLLIVGVVEASQLISGYFKPVKYQEYTFYYKNDNKIARPEYNVTLCENAKGAKAHLTEKQSVIHKATTPTKPVEHEPRNDQACSLENSDYELIVELLNDGEFSKSQSMLLKLISENSENKKELLVLLARLYANTGKLSMAREICEEALESDKLDKDLYYLLATIEHGLNNDEDAIKHLNRAIHLDHEFILAHFLLGNLNLKCGNIAKGRRHIKRAATLLSKLSHEEIVPESEGITAGRFNEIINALKI